MCRIGEALLKLPGQRRLSVDDHSREMIYSLSDIEIALREIDTISHSSRATYSLHSLCESVQRSVIFDGIHHL